MTSASPQRGRRESDTTGEITARAQLASQVQHLSHLAKTLADEKGYLRAVLDSTTDAIVAFNRHGEFVLCNPRFEQLCRINSSEITGHDETWLRDRLRPNLKAPDSFWHEQPHIDLRQEETVKFTGIDGAQTRILHWYSGPVRDESRAVMGRIAVLRDMTRETEIDRMKTDFVSIVSHELRTPMTSIRGYVDLILDGDTGDINPVQRQFLETVQRNTLRLSAMVNDMLDISRIEDGHLDLDIRNILLASLIGDVIRQVQPQTQAKELSVELKFLTDEDPGGLCVRADHDRLIQVLTNLLSNAIKYTPAPPESAGMISIEVQRDGDFALISVRDSGIGIAPEDLQQLFEKFFRANNPRAREVDGSGLGLSITRALVEGMGGHLRVESTLGQGSRFWFSLPLVTGAGDPG